MCAKGKTAFNGLLSIGSKSGRLSPLIASKLYWYCVIPAMLYGAEVLSLSASRLDQLEQDHRNHGKRLQFLPIKSPNPASYSMLGWCSGLHGSQVSHLFSQYYDTQDLQYIQKDSHIQTCRYCVK